MRASILKSFARQDEVKFQIAGGEKYPSYFLVDRERATQYGWEEDTCRELTQSEKDKIFDEEATEFTDAEVAIVNLYNAACDEFDALIKRKQAENKERYGTSLCRDCSHGSGI